MEQATTVFAAGVLGVFVGMAVLYAAIVIVSKVADYLDTEKEPS